MRRVVALGFVYFTYVACAAAPAQPESIAPEPLSPSTPTPAPVPTPGPSVAPSPVTVQTEESPDDAAGKRKASEATAEKVNKSSADVDDSACPAGM